MTITDPDVHEFLEFCVGKLHEGAEAAIGSSSATAAIHRAAGDLVRAAARGDEPPRLPRVHADCLSFQVVVGANAYLCRTWARMLRRPIRDVASASESQRELGALILEHTARRMEKAARLKTPEVITLGEGFWKAVVKSKLRAARELRAAAH